jgi:hypothetical protein
MGSRRTGLMAVFLYNATLTVGFGAMLAIPDVPASLFWVLALWALQRSAERPAFWLCAGAAAGLACLSKYSALFLAPGVLLWLSLTPEGRRRLASPWPWLAALVAVAIFSANVLWNAEHHWLTFAKQFGRAAPTRFAPRYLGEFLAGQFLLLNPAVVVLAGVGAIVAWKRRSDGAGAPLLAAATSIPFAAYLLLHSLHDRVQGHWPAPMFGALAVCAAVAADSFGRSRRADLARRLAPTVGFAVSAAALVVVALPTPTFLGRLDPTLALRGWPRFAQDVEDLRLRTGAAWVGTESYGVFSQLHVENRSAPLLELTERDRYWATDPGRPDFARTGLVVDLSRRMKVADVERCFWHVTPAADLTRAGGPGHNQRYTAYLVSGPKRDVWIIGCPDEIAPGIWK